MVVYYVIRDAERLRTIHSIKDSTEAAFQKLMREENGPSVLELVAVTTDQFGSVVKCILVASWTRRSNMIVTHMEDVTGDYLMI